MLDAVLREKYRVMTKTTGSDARIIHVDGRDKAIYRIAPSNIREQKYAIFKAYREKADILIVECMAVKPELQAMSEEKILKSNIAVITNVRYDHVYEMGETLPEIALSLSRMIPTNGKLFTADNAFFSFFSEQGMIKNTKTFLSHSSKDEKDNEVLVKDIALMLGIPSDSIEQSLQNIQKDIGMRLLFPTKNTNGLPVTFLNLFAANDPISALMQIEPIQKDYKKICFIYNNRWDRPDRLILFAEKFFHVYKDCPIIILGDSKPLAFRFLKKNGCSNLSSARSYKDCFSVAEGSLIVGVGNIRGQGVKMITALGGMEG